ncbi:MAG: PAS domain S-box protein [Chloroflexota bacterium]|nr:PAS domain S-box protein [Chloroflexota bacterium]
MLNTTAEIRQKVERKQNPKTGTTILVVEDDEELCSLLRMRLEKAGFYVDCATAGAEAIQKASELENRDMLAILDYQLPDMTAKELVWKLNNQLQSMPFMVLTGHSDEQVFMDMMRLGAQGFMTKDSGFINRLPQVLFRMIEQVDAKNKLAEIETKLRRSEEWLKTAQRISSTGSWEWNLTSGSFECSDEIYRIYGLPPNHSFHSIHEMIEKTVHPDDMQMVLNEVDNILFSSDIGITYRIIRPDGEVRWVRTLPVEEVPTLGDGSQLVVIGTLRDVTEAIKEAGSTFRVAEKHKILKDTISDVLCTIDRDLRLVEWNRRLESISGFSSEELECRSILDLFDEKDRPFVDASLMSALVVERFDIRANLCTKDGQMVPCQFSGAPVRDLEGNIVGLTGVGRDITDENQADNVLREQGRYFSSLIENLSNGIIVVDVDGFIRYHSPAVDKLLGYRSGDHIMTVISNRVHTDDVDIAIACIDRLISRESSNEIIRIRLYDTDDSCHWVEAVCCSYLDDAVVGGIVINLYDTTRLKRVEERVQSSEEKLRGIVETIADGIGILDLEGNIIDVNESFVHMFGYQIKTDILGEHISKLIDSKNLATILEHKQFALSGDSSSREYAFIDCHGKVFPGEASGSPLYDRLGNPEGMIVIIRDITVRNTIEREQRDMMRAMEEQNKIVTSSHLELQKALAEVEQSREKLQDYTHDLAAKNTQLEAVREELALMNDTLEQRVQERTAEVERLLRHKNAFIGHMGHDLKSPLTPLVALLPMMKSKAMDARDKEILDVILINVSVMQGLVSKALRLSSLDEEDTFEIREEVSLLSQLNTITRGNEQKAEQLGIKIESCVEEDVIVCSDPCAINEVLQHVLDNALKFTPKGGVVNFHVKKEEPFAIVSISDTGIGIDEEQIPHIFEEFYKADQSRHDLLSQGLGLSICERIIQRHEGSIWAESEGIGKGTKVVFTLKLADNQVRGTAKDNGSCRGGNKIKGRAKRMDVLG